PWTRCLATAGRPRGSRASWAGRRGTAGTWPRSGAEQPGGAGRSWSSCSTAVRWGTSVRLAARVLAVSAHATGDPSRLLPRLLSEEDLVGWILGADLFHLDALGLGEQCAPFIGPPVDALRGVESVNVGLPAGFVVVPDFVPVGTHAREIGRASCRERVANTAGWWI